MLASIRRPFLQSAALYFLLHYCSNAKLFGPVSPARKLKIHCQVSPQRLGNSGLQRSWQDILQPAVLQLNACNPSFRQRDIVKDVLLMACRYSRHLLRVLVSTRYPSRAPAVFYETSLKSSSSHLQDISQGFQQSSTRRLSRVFVVVYKTYLKSSSSHLQDISFKSFSRHLQPEIRVHQLN